MNEPLMEDQHFVLLEPHAVLIAKSTPIPGIISGLYESLGGEYRERHQRTDSPAATMEFAGRVCYEAFKAKNPDTDSHAGYLRNIAEQNHGSVFEHSSYSFFLSGISRADSHEIVRHRHLSFSQKSQRYVLNQIPFEISVHPTIAKSFEFEDDVMDFAEPVVENFWKAQGVYEDLREAGYSRKQAAEAARAYLPNAASVNMVVTGNVRSWMEFISKRDHDAADASLQEIAHQIYDILHEELPEIFSFDVRDIWDWQFSQEAPKA